MAEPQKKANPMTTITTTTSYSENDSQVTTQVVIDNNEENKKPVKLEEVSNFSASLNQIIDTLSFLGNYDLTTYYHGVEFNFKCTNYDTNNDNCIEGSALMKENNSLYPLFTYSNDNDNYFKMVKIFIFILVMI